MATLRILKNVALVLVMTACTAQLLAAQTPGDGLFSRPALHGMMKPAGPADFSHRVAASTMSNRDAYLAALVNTAVPGVLATLLISENDNSTTGQVLGLYAVIVGPSGGQLYTRDWARAGIGSGLRFVGLTAYFYGIVSFVDDIWTGPAEDDRNAAILVSGALLTIGATIWSVATVPKSVRRYNDRANLAIGPALGPHGSAGLQLSVRF